MDTKKNVFFNFSFKSMFDSSYQSNEKTVTIIHPSCDFERTVKAPRTHSDCAVHVVNGGIMAGVCILVAAGR